MEPIDPFYNQPTEILLQTILQADPKDLSALCSSSKRLAEICRTFPEVRPLVLRGKYLNMSEAKVQEIFYRYVADKLRGKEKGYASSIAINAVDLEQLTAIVSTYPSLVNKIKKYESPLEMTRDPTIVDLLLRYGAKSQFTVTHDRNVAASRLFQDNNGLIVRQMMAYGGDVFGDRPRNKTIQMLAEHYFEIFYELVQQGVLRGADLELEPNLLLYYPKFYFLYLSLLQAGTPYRTIFRIGYTDPFAFRLAASYQDKGTADEFKLYLSEEDEVSLEDLRAVLASPPTNRAGFLSLEYYQLRQLQNVGSNPYWDDNSFWWEKFERDFPGHAHPLDSMRGGYLKLYEIPELSIQGPAGSYRLSLNYQTGLGFFTCLNLLGREVEITGVRLLGLSGKSGINDTMIEDMESLYRVGNPPMGYTTPFGYSKLDAENSNYNLVLVEDSNDPQYNRMYIPNLFYPYAMQLVVDSRVYYLQFLEVDFFKGYLLLCMVLGLKPREYCPEVYIVDRP
jgi:hypothetical protein